MDFVKSLDFLCKTMEWEMCSIPIGEEINEDDWIWECGAGFGFGRN